MQDYCCCLTLKMLQIGKLDAATNVPNEMLLTFHNEMAYNPQPCKKIMLLCLQPAEKGGESLLARNIDATSNLSKSLLQKFEQKGGVRCGVDEELFHASILRCIAHSCSHCTILTRMIPYQMNQGCTYSLQHSACSCCGCNLHAH